MDLVPPSNTEAECSVLGSMLLDPKTITLAITLLKEEDFYKHANRVVWRTMLEMNESKESIDIVTLRAVLIGRRVLEEIGGLKYLQELESSVPSGALIEKHAEIVRKHARQRNIIAAANAAMRLAEEGKTEEAQAYINDDKLPNVQGVQEVTLYDAMKEFLETEHKSAHPSGLKDLDDAMGGGYWGSGITLIGGDSGAGKTILALQALREAMKLGTPCFIISRDQLRSHIAARVMAAETGIQRRNQNTLGEVDAAVTGKLEEFKSWPLWFHPANYDIDTICSYVKIFHERHRIRMWVLDYLQRVDILGRRLERTSEASSIIANRLADLAQDTQTYGIVISRVTKPQQGVAVQHRLAGEAGVQNAADTILFVSKIGDSDGNRQPRRIEVIGKRHCGHSKVLAILEGAVDRYSNPTFNDKEQLKRLL